MGKSKDAGLRSTRFESQFCCSLAVRPPTTYLNPMRFSFFICKRSWWCFSNRTAVRFTWAYLTWWMAFHKCSLHCYYSIDYILTPQLPLHAVSLKIERMLMFWKKKILSWKPHCHFTLEMLISHPNLSLFSPLSEAAWKVLFLQSKCLTRIDSNRLPFTPVLALGKSEKPHSTRSERWLRTHCEAYMNPRCCWWPSAAGFTKCLVAPHRDTK